MGGAGVPRLRFDDRNSRARHGIGAHDYAAGARDDHRSVVGSSRVGDPVLLDPVAGAMR